MKVPITVNARDFIYQALKQGVKIKSRYIGVHLLYIKPKSRAYWCAQWNKGKKREKKCFPLTHEGEREAHEHYLKNKQS